MFEIWFLISNFTLFKDLTLGFNHLMLTINHMSLNLLSHQDLENLKKKLCMLLFKSSWSSHSIEFVLHLSIQQLHF
jgi:translation elongation factor EF-1alpha